MISSSSGFNLLFLALLAALIFGISCWLLFLGVLKLSVRLQKPWLGSGFLGLLLIGINTAFYRWHQEAYAPLRWLWVWTPAVIVNGSLIFGFLMTRKRLRQSPPPKTL